MRCVRTVTAAARWRDNEAAPRERGSVDTVGELLRHILGNAAFRDDLRVAVALFTGARKLQVMRARLRVARRSDVVHAMAIDAPRRVLRSLPARRRVNTGGVLRHLVRVTRRAIHFRQLLGVRKVGRRRKILVALHASHRGVDRRVELRRCADDRTAVGADQAVVAVTCETVRVRGRLNGGLRYRRPGPGGCSGRLVRPHRKTQCERPDGESRDDDATSAHGRLCWSASPALDGRDDCYFFFSVDM